VEINVKQHAMAYASAHDLAQAMIRAAMTHRKREARTGKAYPN